MPLMTLADSKRIVRAASTLVVFTEFAPDDRTYEHQVRIFDAQMTILESIKPEFVAVASPAPDDPMSHQTAMELAALAVALHSTLYHNAGEADPRGMLPEVERLLSVEIACRIQNELRS